MFEKSVMYLYILTWFHASRTPWFGKQLCHTGIDSRTFWVLCFWVRQVPPKYHKNDFLSSQNSQILPVSNPQTPLPFHGLESIFIKFKTLRFIVSKFQNSRERILFPQRGVLKTALGRPFSTVISRMREGTD